MFCQPVAKATIISQTSLNRLGIKSWLFKSSLCSAVVLLSACGGASNSSSDKLAQSALLGSTSTQSNALDAQTSSTTLSAEQELAILQTEAETAGDDSAESSSDNAMVQNDGLSLRAVDVEAPSTTNPNHQFGSIDTMPVQGEVPVGDATAASQGKWSAAFNTGVVAIHASLMPNGDLMYFGTEATAKAANYPIALSFGVAQSGKTPTVFPQGISVSSFCTATMPLVDGSLIIAGGTSAHDSKATPRYKGANLLVKYQTGNTAFSQVGRGLLKSRWYPTASLLPDGRVLYTGGRDNVGNPVYTPEIVNPTTGQSTLLTGITAKAAGWSYPRVVDLGNNEFLGMGPKGNFVKINTTGKGKATVFANNQSGQLPEGPVVMLGAKKFLVAGSYANSLATASTKLVTVGATNLNIQTQGNMTVPRSYHSMTAMPDGSVIATAGINIVNNKQPHDIKQAVYHAERWVEGKGWTKLASAQKPRGYHNSAILMPDATLISMGATEPMWQFNAEVFYPPYLYNADGTPRTRPVIDSVTSAGGRSNLTVNLSATSSVSRLTMVRVGSATHQQNFSQQFVPLNFTRNGQTLTATVPQDALSAPAGHYMVFALDANGTPSIAKIVRIG